MKKILVAVAASAFISFASAQDEAQPAKEASEGEKVGLLQGKIDSLEEQYTETKNDVLSLKKLKFSGYIQGRYTYNESSTPTKPVSRDNFSVRRGRLKATYDATWSRYVLQIDAAPSGVVLKDAEVHLVEPWSGNKWELVIGQQKWPFGYEVIQSSGDREFPERTRVVAAFFPGERDRGAQVVGKLWKLNLRFGAFNGNGTSHAGFAGVDNDLDKDAMGRVGFDFDWIAGGFSFSYGTTLRPGFTTLSGATPTWTHGKHFVRERVGGDIQIYLDVLPLGGTALKGEYIAGKTYFDSANVERYNVPAAGYWLLLVQNLGLSNALAVRYDHFDPQQGQGNWFDAKDSKKPGALNSVDTFGAAWIHYWDDALKISLVYEVPMTGLRAPAMDPRDNVLTVQLQAKF